MWGRDWSFEAAENIDGVNTLLWKFTDNYGGYDSFLLTFHDQNWDYYGEGTAGWPGDPRYGDSPEPQFYRTETNFNLDLNDDGHIGAPPEKAKNYTTYE